jgi:hypothetical protein
MIFVFWSVLRFFFFTFILWSALRFFFFPTVSVIAVLIFTVAVALIISHIQIWPILIFTGIPLFI